MNEKLHQVEESFIKKAYEAACNDWKRRLKEKFPSVFANQPYRFERSQRLETSDSELPILIGNGWAPEGKEMKCLLVKDDYEMKVSEHNGRQVLEFFKK